MKFILVNLILFGGVYALADGPLFGPEFTISTITMQVDINRYETHIINHLVHSQP